MGKHVLRLACYASSEAALEAPGTWSTAAGQAHREAACLAMIAAKRMSPDVSGEQPDEGSSSWEAVEDFVPYGEMLKEHFREMRSVVQKQLEDLRESLRQDIADKLAAEAGARNSIKKHGVEGEIVAMVFKQVS